MMTIKQKLQDMMNVYGREAVVFSGNYCYCLWAYGIIRRYWIDGTGFVTNLSTDVGHYDPESMQIIDLMGR